MDYKTKNGIDANLITVNLQIKCKKYPNRIWDETKVKLYKLILRYT